MTGVWDWRGVRPADAQGWEDAERTHPLLAGEATTKLGVQGRKEIRNVGRREAALPATTVRTPA